jgi:hypothetical protein
MVHKQFFIIRRLIFVSVAMYCDYPSLQIMSNLAINTIYFVYLFSSKPFKGRDKNRMELFNEAIILTASYFLYFFTDWIPDAELKMTFGTILIYLISFDILVNFAYVIYKLIILKRKDRQKKKWMLRYLEI